MFVVMVASECAPVAQAGGLGEVVFGLSRELEKRGHAVDIILPKYDCMRYDQICGLSVAYQDLWVPWYSGFVHCTVWFGFVHGRRCFFIDPHSQDEFFNRGQLYGFHDDVMRFAFFSKAGFGVHAAHRPVPTSSITTTGKPPSCPCYSSRSTSTSGCTTSGRVCYTIHNFGNQGVTVLSR